MKYLIGIPVPKNYKNKIEMIRAEFRILTTQPHITLVPSSALPSDDSFIKDVIEICKETKPFNIKLDKLEELGNRALYINASSSELISLHHKIYSALNIENKKKEFNPHLTIIKQRPTRPINLEKLKKKTGKHLDILNEFKLNSLVIYRQPKERFIYIPFMEIPLYH